jgi:DNA-binding beta-propeller fold protein YncE
MVLKKACGLIIITLIFFSSCEKQKQNVSVRFTIPPLEKTGIFGSYIPEGLVFKILLSCTADDMEPVVIEEPVDYTETTTGFEYTITVPMGKARHFSAMIYAVGPDPTKHPKTYFLAGDGGFVDTEEPELTVELNMLYLLQFGDTNIFIDSQDRVWFSITPLYQYTGEVVGPGLKPQQFNLLTPGGIGLFDGVQFFFVSLDSFLSQRGLDFSGSGLYFTAMDGNDNTIWLGTSQGVFVFDIQSMQFVDFYNIESGRIPLSNPQDDYVTQVMVKRFHEGAGSEVWFLMDGGIVVNNFLNGTFTVVQGTQGNKYHFITEDPTQSVVYAGKYYDSVSGSDYALSLLSWDGTKWGHFGEFLVGTEILKMLQEPSGNIWLSVFEYLNSRELLVNTTMLGPDLFSLSANLIYLTDLNLNGINYKNFQFNISDINSYGNFYYFGSDAGLIIFDKSANDWNLLERINSYIYDNYVRGIKITSYGEPWFTSGIFPTVLPQGVKTGERVTMHPDNSRVVDAIPITNNAQSIPYGIAVSPDGKIYVGWQDYATGYGFISEIDPGTGSVQPIQLSGAVSASPFFVRMSPDGTKLYASDSPGDKIWVIDLATKNVTSYPTNPVFGPFNFVVSKDGTRGYFLNDTVSPYSIKVIDLVSNIGYQIDEIPIPTAGYVNDMVLTSDETIAYVADGSSNTIFKVDLVNKTASELIKFPPDFSGFTFSPTKLLLDEQSNRLIAGGMYVDSDTIVEIPVADPTHYHMNYALLNFYIYIADMLFAPDRAVMFVTYDWSDYFHVFDGMNIDTIRAESFFKTPGFQGGPMVSSPDGKTVYVITGQYTMGWQLNLEIIR